MKKIIFSDFDETLINYYKKEVFTEKDIDILKKVKEKNIVFCITTGRPINFFFKFTELLNYVDYIISSNGAEIYDVFNSKLIYNKSIDKNSSNVVFDYCINNNIKYFVNSGLNRYSNYDKIDDNVDINQIVFLPSKDIFEELKSFLVGIFEIKLSNIVYNDTRCSIDINNKDVSKGEAIKYLCNLLNINIEDSIGFGDSDNDLSIFEVVGKSICVKNANDVIKQLVDEVIDTCDNDGVFKYLEQNILD